MRHKGFQKPHLSLRPSWLFAVPGFPMSSRCSLLNAASSSSRTCDSTTHATVMRGETSLRRGDAPRCHAPPGHLAPSRMRAALVPQACAVRGSLTQLPCRALQQRARPACAQKLRQAGEAYVMANGERWHAPACSAAESEASLSFSATICSSWARCSAPAAKRLPSHATSSPGVVVAARPDSARRRRRCAEQPRCAGEGAASGVLAVNIAPSPSEATLRGRAAHAGWSRSASKPRHARPLEGARL